MVNGLKPHLKITEIQAKPLIYLRQLDTSISSHLDVWRSNLAANRAKSSLCERGGIGRRTRLRT